MVIKIFDKLKLWIKKITESVYEQDITYFEIKEHLVKKFPKSIIRITDLKKRTCSYKTLKLITSLHPVKYRKYKLDDFDCDKYARVFWGDMARLFYDLPIAYVEAKVKNGGLHALNLGVYKTKSGRVDSTFIEPQTGKIFVSGKYQPTLIVI